MKKIWVPKSYVESLQVNVLMTPPVKNRNPRSNSSYGSNSSNGSKSSYDYHRANNSVSQGRAKGYEYAHYLALPVNPHIPLMSHLTPTINCSRIRMVKYLLDMLELTTGMAPL